MTFLVFLLVVIQTVNCFPCGQCDCLGRVKILSCVGMNVSELPVLDDAHWVKQVDLINTNISSIPPLSNLINLNTLVIRGNLGIDCDQVDHIRNKRGDLLVMTDCGALVLENPDLPEWINCLAALPVLITLSLLGYIGHRRQRVRTAHRRQRRERTETAEQTTLA